MSLTRQYEAAHEDAVLIERPERAVVALEGADRASYLQGLLTNDIVALRPGQGCYACYLTPQGRMIADMNVLAIEGAILLDLRRDLKDTVVGRLNDFIFAEDVRVTDRTEAFASVGVHGPGAAARLRGVLRIDALPEGRELDHVGTMWRQEEIIVTRSGDFGLDGFTIYGSPSGIEEVVTVLSGQGLERASRALVDVLRIEAGRPEFHVDMDEDTIPLEAGLEERAISFDKGCYVGQEVIVRVLHRGHGRVVRKLVGLVGEGGPGRSLLTRGDRVHAGGQEVGMVTSAGWSPGLDRPIALAYVHRDHNAAGTRLEVHAADGPTAVVVATFPFGRA
jgi:folate-binding protein YgfZ